MHLFPFLPPKDYQRDTHVTCRRLVITVIVHHKKWNWLMSYISPNVMLFWWTTGLWEAMLWLPLPFFSIPFGEPSDDFLLLSAIVLMFIMTRLPVSLRSLVDLAKFLLRFVGVEPFRDIRTVPLLCEFISGEFSRFSCETKCRHWTFCRMQQWTVKSASFVWF